MPQHTTVPTGLPGLHLVADSQIMCYCLADSFWLWATIMCSTLFMVCTFYPCTGKSNCLHAS